MASVKEQISASLRESSAILAKVAEDVSVIEKIADALLACYRAGGKMVLFGNGGSAADAQHMAAELVGSFHDRGRKALPALSLTVDTSAITAIGNDYGYDHVFSRQVEALVNKGDVVIAMSTSGNSPNVLKGAEAAKARGAVVVGFTGEGGGKLKAVSDFCFCVPSKHTPHIQETHTAVGHILCHFVDQMASAKP